MSHVARPLAKYTRFLTHHHFQPTELVIPTLHCYRSRLYWRNLCEINPRHVKSVYLPIHLCKHPSRTLRSRERPYSTNIYRSLPSIFKSQITTKNNDLRQRLNVPIRRRSAAETPKVTNPSDTPQQTYGTMEIHYKACSLVWWFLGTSHWSYQSLPKKGLRQSKHLPSRAPNDRN